MPETRTSLRKQALCCATGLSSAVRTLPAREKSSALPCSDEPFACAGHGRERANNSERQRLPSILACDRSGRGHNCHVAASTTAQITSSMIGLLGPIEGKHRKRVLELKKINWLHQMKCKTGFCRSLLFTLLALNSIPFSWRPWHSVWRFAAHHLADR